MTFSLRTVLALALTVGSGALVEVEQHQDGFPAHMKRVELKGWTLAAPADPDARLELLIAVKQENVEELKAMALAVSDPTSSDYGAHLSTEEAHDIVAPSAASAASVRGWLASHGVAAETATPNGDFLRASVSVAVAEALLNTTYGLWRRGESETALRTTTPYALPEGVAAKVDFVAPTLTFPPRRREEAAAGGLTKVTPAQLRALYGLADDDVGDPSANNTMAVASFLGEYYVVSDMEQFQTQYPPAGDRTLRTTYVDVPATQPHDPAGYEASLDTQCVRALSLTVRHSFVLAHPPLHLAVGAVLPRYLAALGAGVSAEHWSTEGRQPGNVENEPFVDWLTLVDSTERAPDLFSISYGESP